MRRLIEWAVGNPLIVLVLAVGLAGGGVYSFLNVSVEAYPDPAPAIIEVIAQYPGASAEEVERQITIPLEVTLAGMPGLKYTRSKSLFGLAHLRNQFEYGVDYYKARQEVINRLQFTQALPANVTPQISPQSPTGEIFRYTVSGPADRLGRPIYDLSDLKALQDWTLEREFRRVPGIVDVTGAGGTIKRYEIHVDPDRLKRFGLTLQQLQDAITKNNANVGGDYLPQGSVVHTVRGLGLLGGGQDPLQQVLSMQDPFTAAAHLRAQQQRRIREIRRIVVTSVNTMPVHVEDLVDGGPIAPGQIVERGVVAAHQTRLGRVSISSPAGRSAGSWPVGDSEEVGAWNTNYDTVQGIVLLRKNEESLAALRDVKAKTRELNEQPGRLPPGIKIEPYYDRTDLINVTTETVRENIAVGMGLVVVILLMFLSNVRSALIVALNIPLALFFAFTLLLARGKTANLLSIGAVDFGIIVDSSVIMVENIYRHLGSGEGREYAFKDRILLACREVEKALFYSTAIMVCAFIPLFTMKGPEGQIFGPMADTYAFALAGALLLALTVSPVLCVFLLRKVKPAPDNFLVRWLKARYLRQLERCLNQRWLTLALFACLIAVTAVYALPRLGNEFMPELEEGNLWIRGTFPPNVTLEEVASRVANPEAAAGKRLAAHAGDSRDEPTTVDALSIIRGYPEVESVVAMLGRPDDGTDPTGFYNAELFVPLKPDNQWPAVKQNQGWRKWLAPKRPRTKTELIDEMSGELNRYLLGVDWNFSQNIRDNVMESLSGVKGDNSVKIFGPDLDKLEQIAGQVKSALASIQGIENVGVFHVLGQSNLEMRPDPEKCDRFGVSVADVENVIDTVIRGKGITSMIEGEKTFDVTLRLARPLRGSLNDILSVPVDVTNSQITIGQLAGVSATGTSNPSPTSTGSQSMTFNVNLLNAPRRPLGMLVSPVDKDGLPDANGQFIRAGASTIYREQGNRLIAVKFSVRGRDLGSAVAEARAKTEPLLEVPYRAEWSGEFQEMEEAERRLLLIIPLSLLLIFILLYLSFKSLLDSLLVFSNVVAMSLGGVWALLLTDTNFSISAAVGFISIFGVAIMDGLLLVSYFNQMRLGGLPLKEAIMRGAEKRIRPSMMTSLTAIFGLLPAAISTRIGAQTQRPLAIVVVGGMITTLFLTRYLAPVLYTFYGQRQPSAAAGSLSH